MDPLYTRPAHEVPVQLYLFSLFPRAFNMRKFSSAGTPLQPLPPTLSEHIPEISEFMQACHALCMRLLEAFARTLDVRFRFINRLFKF